MAASIASTTLIEDAAKLVAYWEDLRTTEPHELRAHLTLGRMCTAFYEALGITDDWYLRMDWTFWPVRKEALTLVLLVGRVEGVPRATMREGAAHDMDQHYTPRDLRRQLDKGDYGILGSWAPWVNAYFLNAIRNALFGLVHTDVKGAAWNHGEAVPGAAAIKAARVAIVTAADILPAFRPISPSQLKGIETRLGTKASVRTSMIWRAASLLDVRISPQNIPLDRLRGRSPPKGMPHKGNALTITEQVVLYLTEELGMGTQAIAEALEMADFRQADAALTSAREKKGKWKRHLQQHGQKGYISGASTLPIHRVGCRPRRGHAGARDDQIRRPGQ